MGTIRKPQERERARHLRREGEPIKRIAAELGVSPSSVHAWTRDIRLSATQRDRNLSGRRGPRNPEVIARRVATWRRVNRERRSRYQSEGRLRARDGEPLHLAGCMLYWAEGSKGRNSLIFANSDLGMVVFFRRFLDECFGLDPSDLTLRLNVYLSGELTLDQVESHWLTALGLPRGSLRKPVVNHYPTSSSGGKKDRLPYGVCTLRVRRSTWLVQHIFGAIQEYSGFDQPAWLDGLRR